MVDDFGIITEYDGYWAKDYSHIPPITDAQAEAIIQRAVAKARILKTKWDQEKRDENKE